MKKTLLKTKPKAPPKKKGPDRDASLVTTLRRWQQIERESIEGAGVVMEKTKNPVVRLLMEIVRNDSVQHHRIQQFVIDSLTDAALTLTPDDVAAVWDEIAAHEGREAETIDLAKAAKEECPHFVQRELLDYVLADELKHEKLFLHLEQLKKRLY